MTDETMIHDEPSHRPGQDPNAFAPETEEHYGSRIKWYRETLAKCRGLAPDTTIRHLERELERYQGWLDGLIANKRHEGKPIRYEYALPEDIVFIEGECPFTGGGAPYTKQQMLAACMGDDVAASRLTTACLECGAKRYDKVSQDGYESFAYNGSIRELREIYRSDTIYNRVVLVHDDCRLTEIVFDNGLDHIVGDADPIIDFDAWDRRLEAVRDAFAEFSRSALGKEARLVRLSPAKNYVRETPPLFGFNGDVAQGDIVIEALAARMRTELQVDIVGSNLPSKLQETLMALPDMLKQVEQDIPACRP